jgi:hypothetical protein
MQKQTICIPALYVIRLSIFCLEELPSSVPYRENQPLLLPFPLEINGRFERKKKKSPVGATEDGGSSIVRTSFQVENFTFT